MVAKVCGRFPVDQVGRIHERGGVVREARGARGLLLLLLKPMAESRWDRSQLDRRASPRAEYRRTAPARLDVAGQACAVRDVNTNGLRVEPAPPGRAWCPGQAVSGVLHLRTSPPTPVAGRIHRIGRAGLVIVPDGSGTWPPAAAIETERHELQWNQRDRRGAPRIPLPMFLPSDTTPSPLRDLSATGLRYMLPRGERMPALGSATEGEVRLDADTVITIRGRVVRHTGREIAIALDPPGLGPDVLALLRRRFSGASSEPLP
jgi:hypothetical protein